MKNVKIIKRPTDFNGEVQFLRKNLMSVLKEKCKEISTIINNSVLIKDELISKNKDGDKQDIINSYNSDLASKIYSSILFNLCDDLGHFIENSPRFLICPVKILNDIFSEYYDEEGRIEVLKGVKDCVAEYIDSLIKESEQQHDE